MIPHCLCHPAAHTLAHSYNSPNWISSCTATRGRANSGHLAGCTVACMEIPPSSTATSAVSLGASQPGYISNSVLNMRRCISSMAGIEKGHGPVRGIYSCDILVCIFVRMLSWMPSLLKVAAIFPNTTLPRWDVGRTSASQVLGWGKVEVNVKPKRCSQGSVDRNHWPRDGSLRPDSYKTFQRPAISLNCWKTGLLSAWLLK